MRNLLYVTVALGALAIGQSAAAQAVDAPPAAQQADGAPTAQDGKATPVGSDAPVAVATAPSGDPAVPGSPTEQTASETGLKDIVVTAQRRSESLQRAGIAVDVVAGDKLVSQGVSTAQDLNKLVPSLNVQNNGGANAVFFLRGVGNFSVNGYTDPAIAFNYDGVYLGRPTSTSGVFYDLERVEVLKGPQGTLYGRNATGGAINILPVKPKPGELSGYVTGSYGNYDAFNVQGALNLPLGEDGAVRVSGNAVGHKGYLDDGTSDERTQALRVQILGKLTPSLTVRSSFDYSHTGGVGAGSSYAGSFAYNRATGQYGYTPSGLSAANGLLDAASQAYRQTLYVGQAGRNYAPLDSTIYEDNRFFGAQSEISLDTGAGTLTVLPAWRYSNLNNRFGVPGFIGYIQEKDQQYSVEARFNGKRIGIFDYIAGFYYFNETVKGNYTFAQQVLDVFQEFTSKTTSYAGFGRVTAHLTDRLRLIGGLRYTSDDKRFAGQADVFALVCTVAVAGRPSCPTTPLLPVADNYSELQPPFIVAPPGQARPVGATGAILARTTTPVDAGNNTGRVTYRAAAEFDLGPRSLLYASYETGYRSGGFSLAAGHATFAPEFLDAYTIGVKNRFLDNRVQLNIEAFYWKYRDQQVNHGGIDANGNQGQFTENIGRSTNKGVEAELQVLPLHNTLLGANVQYLDARYDSFVYTQPAGNTPPLTGCTYRVSTRLANSYDIDCSGKQAYQSPRWTVSLGAQQTVPLGDHKIVASVDTIFKTSRVTGFEYLPYEIAPSSWTTNAQLGFGDAGDRWSITGFVRNIENTRIVTAALYNASVPVGSIITSPPRTYGVRGSFRF